MQPEQNVNPSNRYLICTSTLDEQALSVLKKKVAEFNEPRIKDTFYYQFMDWKPSNNEIAVTTTYAYADIPLPAVFDNIFLVENAETCINASFTITMTIINRWTPYQQIDHGHKHILLLRFDTTIPEILTQLPATVSSIDSKHRKLGLCRSSDFNAIKSHLAFAAT